MKTKIILFVGLMLTFFFMGKAQNPPNLNELLSRLDQNHSGAVTDVFSPSEILTLQTYFNANRTEEDITENRLPTNTVSAPENVNGNFGHFQAGNPGTFNIVGPSGAIDFEGAGAFNPFTGLMYIVDNVGNSYSIDPNIGNYASLGMVTAPPGESFTGLEFDPTDGTLYAISTDGAGSSTLSTIDPATATVTVIGNTAIVLAIALAFDLTGGLFTYDIDMDMAYRIDKANAQATLLGAIGFDASFGQGMFLDPIAGFIYLTAFNNTAFRSELRMLNTTTGATSLIAPIGDNVPGGLLQFAWASLNKSTLLDVQDNPLASLKLYPNPSNNFINLKSIEPINEVAVYNVLGQLVLKESINSISATVDISNLKSGSYFANITINDERVSKHFIKE